MMDAEGSALSPSRRAGADFLIVCANSIVS